MRPKFVVLASGSPRRVEYLREIGVPFEIEVSGADEIEDPDPGAAPDWVAMENARRKAAAVSEKRPDQWILGADTVVWRDGSFYSKPVDFADAKRMLKELSNGWHSVITGVCLIPPHGAEPRLFHDVTRVLFRPLDDAQIESYLKRIHPFDKAGSYAIQEGREEIIVTIEGSYSNVVGLPVERLTSELDSAVLE